MLLDSFSRSTISIGSTVDSCLDALSESPADTCGDQESQVAYADKVKECLTNGLMGTLQGLNDDLRDEKKIRKAMAPLIEVSWGVGGRVKRWRGWSAVRHSFIP